MARIVDEHSLARTLWNLEEARIDGDAGDDPEIAYALDWIAVRQAGPRAYRGILFAPAPDDLERHLGTPTMDGAVLGLGGAAHVLGEESVRALSLWGRSEGWNREEVLAGILRRFHGDAHDWETSGHFCCAQCSVARWRALAAGKPPGWEEVVEDGLRMLDSHFMTDTGRWRYWPFYYTLLALADLPPEMSRDARHRIRPAAERALRRLHGSDQVTRFRRRAAEWALG